MVIGRALSKAAENDLRDAAVGSGEGGSITGREQLVLAAHPTSPNRADGVDDVLRRQPKAARNLRRTGVAAAERSAFGEQIRAGGAMDRAVDPAAAEQGAIR